MRVSTISNFQQSKALVQKFHQEMATSSYSNVAEVLGKYTADDYTLYGVHPFNEISGSDNVASKLWQPLYQAWPNLQRRQDIFIAGTSEISGEQWVMSMGHFVGLRDHAWLGIPPTRKMGFLRYAEFNCVVEGKITKTGFFCDIISVMHQAGLQPLPQQTGASFIVPGPRTHDGLQFDQQDPEEAKSTLAVVNRMIDDLSLQNESLDDRCPPEVLARTWHNDMIWYGPAGIGSSYTIPRYQEQHQHPFRMGLKNKKFNGHVCRFAEGNYACFFGWPNLTNTPVGGFLGLPGNEIKADMRVVDVYRRDGDKLAENWVIIDLPYWLLQQGIDVLARTESMVP